LFEWGETLREQRNLGAHEPEHDISRTDARDGLDFVLAICEYVFVLSEKYKEFRDRQAARKASAVKPPLPPT
jgi:hypothetical protein